MRELVVVLILLVLLIGSTFSCTKGPMPDSKFFRPAPVNTKLQKEMKEFREKCDKVKCGDRFVILSGFYKGQPGHVDSVHYEGFVFKLDSGKEISVRCSEIIKK